MYRELASKNNIKMKTGLSIQAQPHLLGTLVKIYGKSLGKPLKKVYILSAPVQ